VPYLLGTSSGVARYSRRRDEVRHARSRDHGCGPERITRTDRTLGVPALLEEAKPPFGAAFFFGTVLAGRLEHLDQENFPPGGEVEHREPNRAA
jgi:hypothetical protein